MKVSEANAIIHSLSNPQKMPCKSFGLSADLCKTGGKLRTVQGSVCSDCYACKGRYRMPNVSEAHAARLEGMNNPLWNDAMIRLIGRDEFFRWFDSGDLQSYDMLLRIVSIVRATPNTRHWLPTKEKALILRYVREHGEFPKNLTIRVSAAMIDGKPPVVPDGVNTSTVHDTSAPYGEACNAPSQNGFCKDCRACWDRGVTNISYHRH